MCIIRIEREYSILQQINLPQRQKFMNMEIEFSDIKHLKRKSAKNPV